MTTEKKSTVNVRLYIKNAIELAASQTGVLLDPTDGEAHGTPLLITQDATNPYAFVVQQGSTKYRVLVKPLKD